MSDVISNQIKPIKNGYPAMWDIVVSELPEHPNKIIQKIKEDILKRDAFGLSKYGTRLQPFNGRDCLLDAYEELLDGIVYIRQKVYEIEGLTLSHDNELIKVWLKTTYHNIIENAIKIKKIMEIKKENDEIKPTNSRNS